MPADKPTPTDNEPNKQLFEFKNDTPLLPEHRETDLPTDFLTYGTSDDDLQF